MRLLLIAIAASTTIGCQLTELFVPRAKYDTSKIDIALVGDGQVRVAGRPGAITQGGVTGVSVTFWRPKAAQRRLLHSSAATENTGTIMGGELVRVDAQGGFPEVRFGSAEKPVFSGDEVRFAARKGPDPLNGTYGEDTWQSLESYLTMHVP